MKSGSDHDTPLFYAPTGAYVHGRAANGRLGEGKKKGAGCPRAHTARSQSRGARRSRVLRATPRRGGVGARTLFLFRDFTPSPTEARWPSGLPPVASDLPANILATRHGLDRRPSGHLPVSQAQ